MKRFILYILFSAGVSSAFAQSESLTVDQYRQKVLDYSIELKQSGEQVDAVKNAMLEAKTAFLPRLDFSGNAQYRVNDYDLDLGGTLMNMPGESYSLNADLAQVVYGGGAVKESYKASKLQHEVSVKQNELTATNIIYSANVLYWTVGAKDALERLTGRYVEIISELENVISMRFEDGLISKTDLLQIQSRLSDAKIQQNEAHKSYVISLQNLNVLMGNSPLLKVELTDLINKDYVIPLSIMSLDEVLDRRQEYQVAGLAANIQESKFKIERSKFLPQLSVGVKEAWGTQSLNFDGSTMFNTYLYAAVKIPIFHWGAKYKNVASQKALWRSSKYDIQRTKDNITQELYSAYTDLVESRKQVFIAEEAVDISNQSLDLNTFSYNEGKLPIVDVLSAQVAWVQASSALIRSWLQEKIAYSDYNKAIGNVNY